MPDQPEDANGLDLPPFNWEKLFRWLFVSGVLLWVLAGALTSVLVAYFSDFFYAQTGDFVSNTAGAGGSVFRITQISVTAESIAFKVWVASGALLAFMWLRARGASEKARPSN